MTPAYTPRPDSLAAQVVYFFRNNPDEELTLDDITEKFGSSRGNIHTQLKPSLEVDLLRRERNPDGEYIYRAGVRLDAIPPAPVAGGKARKPTRYASPRHQLLDLDTLVVEKGVPAFEFNKAAGRTKWEPLFAKLAAVGDSVEVPAELSGAIKAAIYTRKALADGLHFKCALTTAGRARVWRLPPPAKAEAAHKAKG